MRIARSVGSAFLVLLGSMLIVVWALSSQAVKSIEDGSAAEQLTENILTAPQTANFIAERVVTAIDNQIDRPIAGVAFSAIDDRVHDLVVQLLSTDAIAGNVLKGVERLENRLLEEISDPDRPDGAFVIAVDLNTRINGRIDEIPVVGPLIPTLDLPSYEVEAIPADTFQDVRTGFKGLKFAGTWLGLIGVLIIGAGLAISPRWQWFLPRALVAAGALGLAIGFAVSALGPRTIATFVPGGRDGGLGTLIEDVVADTALTPLTTILLILGLVALVLAGVFAAVMRFLPPPARDAEPQSEQDPAPASAATTDA